MISTEKARKVLTRAAIAIAALLIFFAYFTHGLFQRVASGRWALWVPVVLFIIARTMFSERGNAKSRSARTSYALPGGIGYLIGVFTFVVAALGIVFLNDMLFRRFKAHQITDDQQTTLLAIGSIIILLAAVVAGRWVWLRFVPKHPEVH